MELFMLFQHMEIIFEPVIENIFYSWHLSVNKSKMHKM